MELLERLKDFQSNIFAIYLTGSSVLPWVSSPKDRDYIIIVNHKNIPNFCKMRKHRQRGECWFIAVENELKTDTPRIYWYEKYYEQKLYGEDKVVYNIFEHIHDYKKCLINHALNKTFNQNDKNWYHILTGIYLLENGDYFLTDEQAANVQLCHDRQMTQEIYDFIQNILVIYQNELMGFDAD